MLRNIEEITNSVLKLFGFPKKDYFLLAGELNNLIKSFQEKDVYAERLELLGDRVLSLHLTEWLLEEFKLENEGQISKKIGYLSSQEVMGDIVLRRDLYPHPNKKRRADFLESIIGLIHIRKIPDLRLKIQEIWHPYLLIYSEGGFNPKGQLQELLAKRKIHPLYKSRKVKDSFETICSFWERGIQRKFYAWGKNIRSSEMLVAREILYFLKSVKSLSFKLPFIIILAPRWYLNLIQENRREILVTCDKVKIFPLRLELDKNRRKLKFDF